LSTEPEWLVPASLDEALALRAERRDEATVVAGGTSSAFSSTAG
jgi:CO/xanthine dehydrogenase FAD-binding subunit